MPIHYELYYDVSLNDLDCNAWNPTVDSPVEVHLVQTDMVKYPTTRDDYVEEIVVYYTKDANNYYPTEAFVLKVHGKTAAIIMTDPPDRTVLSGSPGTNPAASETASASGHYIWEFTAPEGGDNESTTLFEFDDGSGPPAKLKVKVKKQTGSFSC